MLLSTVHVAEAIFLVVPLCCTASRVELGAASWTDLCCWTAGLVNIQANMHAGHDLAGAGNSIASCQRSSAQLGHGYQSISGETVTRACAFVQSMHARVGDGAVAYNSN